MDVGGLLTELYGRIPPLVRDAVQGLDAQTLATSPEPGANTIGWLVWHLTRVQDSHVAEILDSGQLWVADGWAARFGMEPDPDDTGYAHTRAEMESVRPESDGLLIDYHEAVAARTGQYLESVPPEGLDRVVDYDWSPPVTEGVRLVSVADDSLQHVGQALYVRGILERADSPK